MDETNTTKTSLKIEQKLVNDACVMVFMLFAADS